MPSSADRVPITQGNIVYRYLCMLLSGQTSQVDWESLSSSDWDVMMQIARAEGVASLLHAVLARQEDDGLTLPKAVISELAQSYYQNAAYNANLISELNGILSALTGAGVPIILLKGAALVNTLYTDAAERSMNDIDLLVRRSTILPAVRALQMAGYHRLADNYIRYHVLLHGGQASRVNLELHWSLVFNDERFTAMIDWFWQQSHPLDVSTSLVRVLSPTAHLLYLAAHLALQHSGEARLSWYYDLYLLISRYGNGACDNPSSDGIDWNELLQQAECIGWSVALRHALVSAQTRFGFTLPDDFLARLTEQAMHESGLAKRLVGTHADLPSINMHKSWVSLGWRDRLHMLWGLVLPRPAYLRWRYQPRPIWLWPLYYIKRWKDILVDGVRAVG